MSGHPHPHDPLDYLYEEIPSEKMADARAHFAECPECLREMRSIRETVKAYRARARAAVPGDCKDKVMRRVLEMNRDRRVRNSDELSVVPVRTIADPADGLPAVIHEEIEQIESLRRFRWRTWFFHPAWTVAAAVVFVCAVLIHMSPRRNPWFGAPRDAQPFGQTSATQARDSAASGPTAESKRAVHAGAALPPESGTRFVVPPPSLPMSPPTATESVPPAPRTPAAAPAADPLPPSGGAPKTTGEAWIPGFPPPVRNFGMPSEDALSPFREKADEHPLPGGAPGPDPLDGLPGLSADSSSEPEQGPVIVGFHPGEPPSILARPEPVNRERLILDLTFLAGMQLGQKEFSEAARTIELLMPLHPEKASELFRILDEMTQAQEPMIVSGSDPEAARRNSDEPAPPRAADEQPENSLAPGGEKDGGGEGRPADGPEIPLSGSAQGEGESRDPDIVAGNDADGQNRPVEDAPAAEDMSGDADARENGPPPAEIADGQTEPSPAPEAPEKNALERKGSDQTEDESLEPSADGEPADAFPLSESPQGEGESRGPDIVADDDDDDQNRPVEDAPATEDMSSDADARENGPPPDETADDRTEPSPAPEAPGKNALEGRGNDQTGTESAPPAAVDDSPDEAAVQDGPIAAESLETHETDSGGIPPAVPEALPPALPAAKETVDGPTPPTVEPGPPTESASPPRLQAPPRKPRPFSTDPYVRGD